MDEKKCHKPERKMQGNHIGHVVGVSRAQESQGILPLSDLGEEGTLVA